VDELERAIEWLVGPPEGNRLAARRGRPDLAAVETRPILAEPAGHGLGTRQARPATCEIRPPHPDDAIVSIVARGKPGVTYVGLFAGALLAAAGVCWLARSDVHRLFDLGVPEVSNHVAVGAVVDRIIRVESNGDPHARNARSSATGAAQFLDETWLELIRAYRRDLIDGRGDKELLELRHDLALSREITTRLVERNAGILRRRGLPVTPGTLYLAHFAGVAGAAALLSDRENGDAASLLAGADATGRVTREKIVAANPFLKDYTVLDLKLWADRKMRTSAF
jgi:hypothetical protein